MDAGAFSFVPRLRTLASVSSPWLPYPTPRAAPALHLFCLPHAGGGASLFRGWHERLPPEVEVHPVQPPGREARLGERAHTRIEPLAAELADVLEPHLGAPYALFGHSLGALICCALARERRARGLSLPVRMFLSGASAPHLEPLRRLHDLEEEELVEALREMEGTPESLFAKAELRALFLPLLRADFELVETYRCPEGEPLPVPFVLLGGERDQEVPRERLAAWSVHTSAGAQLELLPAGHFYPLTHEAELTSLVGAALALDCLPGQS